jgi:molybdenum cofactor biosynthesis enzyme MoaA
MRYEARGDISLETGRYIIKTWAKDNLKNIRFSGGEPMLHSHLEDFIGISKDLGINRVAVSSNGSSDPQRYEKLIDLGVDDFSISLDACCASTGNMMSGTEGSYQRVINTIKLIVSRKVYLTVGIVLTKNNIQELSNIILVAHDLGVSDIRVISAAQENMPLKNFVGVDQNVLDLHPILNYRINNIKTGKLIRGLLPTDSPKCYLIQDDSIIAGEYHWPCVIYLRELGEPIGKVHSGMRHDRIKFFELFNPHEDPICRRTCLDVCVDFNNKCHYAIKGVQ